MGKISKTIRVTTDDPGARQFVLRLKANLVAPVIVRPQQRVWLTAVAGQTAKTRLLLHRHDGKPLHITSVTNNNPELVASTLTPVKAAETVNGLAAKPGDVWLTISLKPQERLISRGTRLSLETNVPDEKLVQVPVMIRIRPKVEALPRQLEISLPSKGGQGTYRQVHIRSNTGSKLRVLSVTSDHPKYFVADIRSNEPSMDQIVTVRVTDRAAEEKLSTRIYGRLVVRTDDPSAKEIDIPVVLWRVPEWRSRRPVRRPVFNRGRIHLPENLVRRAPSGEAVQGGKVAAQEPAKATPSPAR